ncbi:class C sortase [Corynebacterium resistens]|uniref:class C sortase n=1 Tax=Corynebacterium resistens TaxID=258224 RepID=UPI002357D2F8|nr:class C sortase [Corynebacterium resistens]
MSIKVAPAFERTPQPKQPSSRRQGLAIASILVILGVLVMLYPVVSTVLNNYKTVKAAENYSKMEQSVPQEVKDEQWAAAHSYNKHLTTGPILDPWLAQVDEKNVDYARYLRQLSATDAMARLVFPKIKTDLPVYHGTSDDTLQQGIGHLYGADLPVGGAGTHSVLTGHTGLSNATMFDNLKHAREGDAFYIQVSGHKLKYVVDQIKVVKPNESDDLRPVQGQDYITLITCTPYGINTHRLLVRGHAVPLDEGEDLVFEKSHGAGWQWWMYALAAVAVAITVAFLWWLRRQKVQPTAQASRESALTERTHPPEAEAEGLNRNDDEE